jgi:hypothetical protein
MIVPRPPVAQYRSGTGRPPGPGGIHLANRQSCASNVDSPAVRDSAVSARPDGLSAFGLEPVLCATSNWNETPPAGAAVIPAAGPGNVKRA